MRSASRWIERRRFGFLLFAGGECDGLPVLFRPESGTICVGKTEAPFALADLPNDEDMDLRIYVDKYLVEVFVNGRLSLLATHMNYRDGSALEAYLYDVAVRVPSMTIRKVEIWKLKPTNQRFFEARENPVWKPDEQ